MPAAAAAGLTLGRVLAVGERVNAATRLLNERHPPAWALAELLRALLLVHIRDAVLVGINRFLSLDPAVLPIARAQDDCAEQGSE